MVNVTVDIVNLDQVVADLSAIPTKVKQRLQVAMSDIGVDLTSHVKSKLSGSVLNSRSGKLRNSINYRVQDAGDQQSVEVESSGVSYAAVHEFGGTISLPEMTPKNVRALHWVTGGQNVFAMRSQAHAVRIPERSFMRSSYDDKEQAIRTRIEEVVDDLL